MPTCSLSIKRFCMFTHFYAAAFSMKTCFYDKRFLSRVLDVFSQNR